MKPKFQHTETWPETVWPSHRLCYRPAVFLCRLSLIALSSPQGKIRCAFQKYFYLFYYFFLKIALSPELRNFKLRK